MASFFETYSTSKFVQILETFNSKNEFVQNENAKIEISNNEKFEFVQTNSAQLDLSKTMAKFLLGISWK